MAVLQFYKDLHVMFGGYGTDSYCDVLPGPCHSVRLLKDLQTAAAYVSSAGICPLF